LQLLDVFDAIHTHALLDGFGVFFLQDPFFFLAPLFLFVPLLFVPFRFDPLRFDFRLPTLNLGQDSLLSLGFLLNIPINALQGS
jgi:hypothetical protein